LTRGGSPRASRRCSKWHSAAFSRRRRAAGGSCSAQRLAADAAGIAGGVAVPAPVPPAGGVPEAESRWPHALSNDDKTSTDAQTTDVIRMAKLPNRLRA
jgi:hypothetical protein